VHHHNVDIKRNIGDIANSSDKGWTDSEIWHKLAVHHIKVEHVCPSRDDPFNLFAKATEICSE
jgi:hypothetical protein